MSCLVVYIVVVCVAYEVRHEIPRDMLKVDSNKHAPRHAPVSAADDAVMLSFLVMSFTSTYTPDA